MMKHILLTVWVCILFNASQAQMLYTSETVYQPGDTIRGTAFFSDKDLMGYTYRIGIYDTVGTFLYEKKTFVKTMNHPWTLPLKSNLPSGNYYVQLRLDQNLRVSHRKPIMIIGKDEAILQKAHYGLSIPKDSVFNITSSFDEKILIEARPHSSIQGLTRSISMTIRDATQNPDIDTKILSSECDLVQKHFSIKDGIISSLKGIMLEGQVLDTLGKPLAGVPLLVTYMQDEEPRFIYTVSNANGIFGVYNILLEGKSKFYIQPIKNAPNVGEIKIAQENTQGMNSNSSCNSIVETPAGLKEAIRIRSLDKKVKLNYSQNTKTPVWEPEPPKPILQARNHLIDFDDYLTFPTMKEMIKEVIPFVFIKKKGVKVFSQGQSKTLNEEPVFLINGRYASEEEFLSLDTKNMKYAEIVNEISSLSFYGAFAYGGMVNIITKTDYENTSFSRVVELQGFDTEQPTYIARRNADIPFFPSLYYWNPKQELNSDNYFTVELDKPDYGARIQVEIIVQLLNGALIKHEETIPYEIN